jgi:hypothetical protein
VLTNRKASDNNLPAPAAVLLYLHLPLGVPMSRDNKVWGITFFIWLIGCGFIYILDKWHFHIALIDTLYGFTIYIVAFFYFLALGPIREFIDRHLP